MSVGSNRASDGVAIRAAPNRFSVRAEVETARVDANLEFFDDFEATVEEDASWAYKFQRE